MITVKCDFPPNKTITGRLHIAEELLKMEFYSKNPIKRLLQKLHIVKMDKLNPKKFLNELQTVTG